MSRPTPVITSIMTVDRGSIRKATSTENVPAVIQEYTTTSTLRSSAGNPISWRKTPSTSAKDTATAAHAIVPDTLGFRLQNTLMKAPSKGRKGINQT